jgi:hypothetical protein
VAIAKAQSLEDEEATSLMPPARMVFVGESPMGEGGSLTSRIGATPKQMIRIRR